VNELLMLFCALYEEIINRKKSFKKKIHTKIFFTLYISPWGILKEFLGILGNFGVVLKLKDKFTDSIFYHFFLGYGWVI
jgi:hypothetical protein